ncbi:MAG: pyridoxal-dependent decarboxylase [Chloroflexota bacterium]|nr:pyridoxal-dependent decarboxylase [Chloroflexota bacterium]
MYPPLAHDRDHLRPLLESTFDAALRHLNALDDKPPATPRGSRVPLALPDEGMGAAAALTLFDHRYGQHMAASAGRRYWGFVTGGTTPAALMGDWLTSAYDINLADGDNSVAPAVEHEAIHLLRALFGLPDAFSGVFVSGATISNFVGLATAREWIAQQRGMSAAQDGLYGMQSIPVFSAAPHSSALKALAMLGMGRKHLIAVDKLPGNREAVDIDDLRRKLDALAGQPCIVIGNAGTVNTTDFDDLQAIAALKRDYPFWLHVDAAFGGFVACSPRYKHLVAGMEHADTLTIDAHKWLNVPYDSAMIFTRHQALQAQVFQNSAAYLPDLGDEPDFFHLTPENSRRFRALPAWFTLMAYGKGGYCEIVERACDLARALGERIAASEQFRLLAPVRTNIVCFTLEEGHGEPSTARIARLLAALRDDGRLFLTPTTYQGVPGIRAAFSNWRTEARDVEIAWDALLTAYGNV